MEKLKCLTKQNLSLARLNPSLMTFVSVVDGKVKGGGNQVPFDVPSISFLSEYGNSCQTILVLADIPYFVIFMTGGRAASYLQI